MNDQQRAAMQMALEALELALDWAPDSLITEEAINALREALAQPQGEPVAWVVEMNGKQYFTAESGIIGHIKYDKEIPLYTTPPSVEAAIEATKEKAAKVLDQMAEEAEADSEPSGYVRYYRGKAAAIRSMK